ncbi:MAG: hypothetical protein PIR02_15325 [Microbacterium enclense]
MGLFVQRPEEPSEWAGLPGEPRRPQSRAEVLPEDDGLESSPAGLLGAAEGRLSSIAIPLDAMTPDGVHPTSTSLAEDPSQD